MQTALARKSFWRLSRTYATQLGMTNEWLSGQGLVSLGELWSAVHYPGSKAKLRHAPEPANLWGWQVPFTNRPLRTRMVGGVGAGG